MSVLSGFHVGPGIIDDGFFVQCTLCNRTGLEEETRYWDWTWEQEDSLVKEQDQSVLCVVTKTVDWDSGKVRVSLEKLRIN